MAKGARPAEDPNRSGSSAVRGSPEEIVDRLVQALADDEPICVRTLVANMVLARRSWPEVVRDLHERRKKNKFAEPGGATPPILEGRITQHKLAMQEAQTMSAEWQRGLTKVHGEIGIAMHRSRHALNQLTTPPAPAETAEPGATNGAAAA